MGPDDLKKWLPGIAGGPESPTRMAKKRASRAPLPIVRKARGVSYGVQVAYAGWQRGLPTS